VCTLVHVSLGDVSSSYIVLSTYRRLHCLVIVNMIRLLFELLTLPSEIFEIVCVYLKLITRLL